MEREAGGWMTESLQVLISMQSRGSCSFLNENKPLNI